MAGKKKSGIAKLIESQLGFEIDTEDPLGSILKAAGVNKTSKEFIEPFGQIPAQLQVFVLTMQRIEMKQDILIDISERIINQLAAGQTNFLTAGEADLTEPPAEFDHGPQPILTATETRSLEGEKTTGELQQIDREFVVH